MEQQRSPEFLAHPVKFNNDRVHVLPSGTCIEATGSHNASEIIGVIEEWVTSTEPGESTLHLWPFVMGLDNRCPASITSLDAPYPTLSGAGGDQAQVSRVKEHIESCLSSDNYNIHPKLQTLAAEPGHD